MNNTSVKSGFRLPAQPEYDHVQNAPAYLIIVAPAFVMLGAAMVVDDVRARTAMLAIVIVLWLIAYSMHHLRVYDAGDALALRYGPIPLLGKWIPYEQITSAQRDRSTLLDGWGIHWIPGRGWTYNLWGFDCVRLTLTGGHTLRIGTNDPEGLAQFLQTRLEGEAQFAR